jgi:DNA (cytosine-5)-methyltransferase 1
MNNIEYAYSMSAVPRPSLSPLTAIDLFAGAGGLTLAAQFCGVEVRAAVEVDLHASSTYKKNLVDPATGFPALLVGDIAKLSWDEVLRKAGLTKGECSLLLGGPPCQGFSVHRIKNAGVNDPRNELLVRYFEGVDAIRPKAFLVENVAGLLWERHASYLKRFYDLAAKSGYSVFQPATLNARDFGVPQNRKRVFVLGFRSDVKVRLVWPPEPTHFAPDSSEVTEQGKPAWQTAATVFSLPMRQNDPNRKHMNHSEALVEVFRKTPRNGGSRHESGRTLACHETHDGHKDVYGRIDPSRPGPTMTTACINPSKGRFVHPTANHGISARHAARFQTFPDSFVFEGGLIASGKQIGNAVPIEHGQHILSLIRDALAPAEVSNSKRRPLSRSGTESKRRVMHA